MSEFLSGFHPEIDLKEKVLSTGIHVLEMAQTYNHPLEAIVFGGSYAQGRFKNNEDLDVDFRYGACDLNKIASFTQAVATQAYLEKGLGLHIRAHINRSGLAVALSKDNPFSGPVHIEQFSQLQLRNIYRKHPNSPFIALDHKVIDFWNLSFK
jgi:hypothetical protein